MKSNCLEVARNLRLCAGAVEYEARIKQLEDACDWILNDAAYKAPEQISNVALRWLDVIKTARAGHR